MTRPTPIWVTKGCPRSTEESNLDPSRRVPVSVPRKTLSATTGSIVRLTVDGHGLSWLWEVLA